MQSDSLPSLRLRICLTDFEIMDICKVVSGKEILQLETCSEFDCMGHPDTSIR
jgi:hypothetical protein